MNPYLLVGSGGEPVFSAKASRGLVEVTTYVTGQSLRLIRTLDRNDARTLAAMILQVCNQLDDQAHEDSPEGQARDLSHLAVRTIFEQAVEREGN